MRCSVTTRRWPATWRTSRTSGRAPYPGTRPRRLFGKVALQPLDPATVDIALAYRVGRRVAGTRVGHKVHRHIVVAQRAIRSEEHTSELQSQSNLVCRLLLE